MRTGMIPRTFRMRIMLLSVSISTAVLLGFGYWTWQILYSYTGLDRLDGELKGLARNQLAIPRPRMDWKNFEEALDYLRDLDPSRSFSFVVLGRDGAIRFQSTNWPGALAPDDFVDPGALDFPPHPEWAGDPDRPGPRPRGLRGAPDAPGPMPPGEVPGPPREPMWPGDGPGRRESVPVNDIALCTHQDNGQAWRAAVLSNPFDLLILAADLTPYNAEVNTLRGTFLIVMIAALLSIGAGGWFLAGRALRPVNALTAAAESITAQELERRIPEEAASLEFARLNRVFNEMLERLDRSFKQATRFSADAAHELKTPLTILQGQLNQLLQEAPPGSPLQQRLGRLLEEVQRLSVIIRKLLLLSLADAGRIKVNLAPVALDAFLESIVEDLEILAPGLTTEQALAPGMVVLADEALLRQAVQNLLNNAIKYNIPDGKIRLELFRHEGKVRFSVANTSTGIAEADRKRVFHRFYRADPAHSRAVDGTGLGLSLAREIVRSHNGKLWLADAPEGWVMFVMELPDAGVM